MTAGLVTLGERPEGDGRVQLPTAPAVSTREIHALIEKRTGRLPDGVVLTEPRPFGPFGEVFTAGYAEMFCRHAESWAMDSSASRRGFDVRSAPLEATLDATLSWYQPGATGG